MSGRRYVTRRMTGERVYVTKHETEVDIAYCHNAKAIIDKMLGREPKEEDDERPTR